MATKPNVAFIGLGAMGMGMALHLLEDGFRVSGFDVSPKALEMLASKGGFAASSPQESARDASYIICMVANAEQIKNVLFAESRGAVFGLPHDAIVIICSTVAPAFPQEVLRLFKEDFQRPDIRVVDCPVSGGTVRAAQGTLTILSSGSSATLKDTKPILESMSECLYEIKGGLGAANKVKLINQQLAGIHIAISAEAMGLAATLGLNTKHLYESVLGTSAHSWMFENRVPHMLADDWTPYSALGIFVKDMGIVTSEGLNRKFPLFLASTAEQLYLLGAQMEYEREDDSGVVRVFLPKSPSLVSDSKSTQMDVSQFAGAYKLIHQLLEIVHTAAAIEAVALGINLGLQASELISIISNAAGVSESFKVVAPKAVLGDFTSGCTIAQTRDTLVSLLYM
ncbi:putative 3-hydroxyisobutyrate dehydrogenase [Talaromyces proteolyticus]|uniref:3-hydroxyisobutyrate dehydrogenase n=1 Tax=Talaromyces proteolyticus TaxID=1131652 RepID=A0AAD4KEH8_9EURO|nr:putative 3-hydroxyisobutyrate dehydrogenase [Talaromyces proteolyticus]KAH8690063.1 putative 3-hydroxyisobutyrate dehydrogenase [Talaromyces proteolyticus]